MHTLGRMIGDRVAEHCASNSMGWPILHGLSVGDDWCLCVEMHCCRLYIMPSASRPTLSASLYVC